MRLLSEMKPENGLAAWKIIGKGVDEFFMPKDAFVCNLCAGKVRYAQSVSNRSDPRKRAIPVYNRPDYDWIGPC